MVVVEVEVVVVVVVVLVVGFGVVLGRGVALGGVPGKEIKWASWIILLISNTVFLALVKKIWMNWSNKVFLWEYDVQSHWSCIFDSWKCKKIFWTFLKVLTHQANKYLNQILFIKIT